MTMNENQEYSPPLLEKYIRCFALKTIQVIVQSRTGIRKRRLSRTNPTASEWFNLAIDDEPSIQERGKRALSSQPLLTSFSLCIEIQVETTENDKLVLETWCLNLRERQGFRVSMTEVYSNMSVLLKSIIAVSRASPAYKLAAQQCSDSYTILYRLYFGPPQVHVLGKDREEHKIGEVATPIGLLMMSLAYCTDMTITPQKTDKVNQFLVKSDHFKPDMQPKGFNFGGENVQNRCTNLNDSLSPLDFKIPAAFAPSSDVSNEKLIADLMLPDGPFINMLSCKAEQNERQNSSGSQNGSSQNDNTDNNANVSQHSSDEEKIDYNCNDNKCFNKLSGSDYSECDDFVMVELKPAFADCDSSDVGVFFKECQFAPTLASFASQPSLEEQVLDISTQLEKFETCMPDFDSFVDSVCQVDGQK